MLKKRFLLFKLTCYLIFIIISLNFFYSYQFSNEIIDNFDKKSFSHENIFSQKINGCILILYSKKHLPLLFKLIRRIDLVFNSKYKYPYIILHSEEHSKHFKNKLTQYTNSKIEFGLIPKEHWSVPDWIDREKLNESIRKIGYSTEYRHMCRFKSGFFFRHELTLKYDYFMLVDSDSLFHCKLYDDPFKRFQNSEIKYGFALAQQEALWTIPTLWSTIRNWTKEYSIKINADNLGFISSNKGDTLNNKMCIFYLNFEMGDFSVFRNERYLQYFDYLDKSGGFFYERWVNL